MSKVDAQRAMREARYAARTRGPAAPPASAAPSSAPSSASPPAAPARSAAPPVVPPSPPEPEPREHPATSTTDAVGNDVEVCGHRNMSNKSCRRPAGHAEKNHRYR
jgi:hypothetical protein